MMNNIFCNRAGGATIDGVFFPLQPVSYRREIESERKIMSYRIRDEKRKHKSFLANLPFLHRNAARQQKLNDRPWHLKLKQKIGGMFRGR